MMQGNQHKVKWFQRIGQMVATSIFLFAASPSYAGYYGGHGHHYGYGYSHGYSHGYGHHGGHFSYHGHGHDSHLGYVLLGLTGVVLLAHLLNQVDDYPRKRSFNPYGYRSEPGNMPARQRSYPSPQNYQAKKLLLPAYGAREGWDWLAKGDTEQALNIFAIQSQQDLNSGTAKIGFAIAVAIDGDLDRGTRAMRRALRVDPAALRDLYVNEDLETKIALLSEEFQSTFQKQSRRADAAFMIAALSYLQQDYVSASDAVNDAITAGDRDQSTNNLRQLVDNKLVGIHR